MANIMAVVYFVVGSIVLHTGLIVWTAVMLRAPVAEARRTMRRQPVRNLGWGVMALAAAGLVAAGFLTIRQNLIEFVSGWLSAASTFFQVSRLTHDAHFLTHVWGWLLAAPFFLGLAVGEAALVTLFASRIGGRDSSTPAWPMLLGAACLSGSYFVPFLGWFCFLPLVGCLSLGTGVRGLWLVAASGRISLKKPRPATVDKLGLPSLSLNQ